ncbi:aminotransferase-like domain-containing protein [Streptomyces sp. NBC_01304]|uniref:aminotransferase-like domain-containing protein n=1 Tax=Streptomyces sp. NBC_01304 TaxID=2903818 RepID=UPI002E0FB044|nr:PLP-dependent aminotransferase family protein [Streptomyces sp. NBC_01304]
MNDSGAALLAADLSTDRLHSSLRDPALASMNFLNEVAGRFPEAISLAAGRPSEDFFDVDDLPRYLQIFCDYLAAEKGADTELVRRTLFQYGRTKGIIHELLARHLACDEGIDVDPESIVVTVGCQEAMFLVLRALRTDERDVLLTASPCYVGLTGAARLVDMPLWPVRENEDGIDLDHLVEQIEAVRAAGKRPRAFYLVPDFANPSGASIGLEARQKLLAIAAEHDLLILEDNPYGLFQAGDGQRLPTLKALDTSRRVIYLGSLAKTCFPGARIGFVVANQRVARAEGDLTLFADELSKIKSMLTVNTSPVAQAVAGGKLLEHDCSLVKANVRETQLYSRNLRLLLEGLERRFPRGENHQVSWNAPGGGFFAVVNVPFIADDAALEYGASKYGVLWTPMSHFYDGRGGENQLRLSVSVVSPAEIEAGLDRLAMLIADLSGKEKSTQ